ncbi:Uncharacterised protein [Neisseria meningitidis]|nr:Uncharacterised protein [Neisseria meningitidis]
MLLLYLLKQRAHGSFSINTPLKRACVTSRPFCPNFALFCHADISRHDKTVAKQARSDSSNRACFLRCSRLICAVTVGRSVPARYRNPCMARRGPPYPAPAPLLLPFTAGFFLKLRVTASADRVLFCPYRAAEICVHLRSFRKERTSPGWGCGTVSAWVYYSGFRLGTAFRWGCLKTVCRCRYPAIRAIRPSRRHALLSCRGVYGRSRTGTLPKPAADNAAVTS